MIDALAGLVAQQQVDVGLHYSSSSAEMAPWAIGAIIVLYLGWMIMRRAFRSKREVELGMTAWSFEKMKEQGLITAEELARVKKKAVLHDAEAMLASAKKPLITAKTMEKASPAALPDEVIAPTEEELEEARKAAKLRAEVEAEHGDRFDKYRDVPVGKSGELGVVNNELSAGPSATDRPVVTTGSKAGNPPDVPPGMSPPSTRPDYEGMLRAGVITRTEYDEMTKKS